MKTNRRFALFEVDGVQQRMGEEEVSCMFEPKSIGIVPDSSKYVDGLITQPTPTTGESCLSVLIVHPSGSVAVDAGPQQRASTALPCFMAARIPYMQRAI